MALTGEMKLGNVALTAAICLYLRSEGLEPQGDVRWGTQKREGAKSDERENVAYVEVRTGERPLAGVTVRRETPETEEYYRALYDLLEPEREEGEDPPQTARRLLRELKDLRFQMQRLSVPDPVGELLRALPKPEDESLMFWCVLPSLTNTAFEPPTHASLQLRRTSDTGSDLVASRYISLASGERDGVLAMARRMLSDHAVPLEQNPEWQEIEREMVSPANPIPVSASSPVPDEPKLTDLVDENPEIVTCDNGCGAVAPEKSDPEAEEWIYVSELDGALFCPQCYADLPEGAKTPTTSIEDAADLAAVRAALKEQGDEPLRPWDDVKCELAPEARVFTEAPGPETTERLKRDYAGELAKIPAPIPDQVPCVAELHEQMRDGMQRAATTIIQNEGKNQGRRKKSDPKPKEPESEVSL